MQRFTGNGTTVALRDVGTGPPIVMLHNGGTSSTIWRHQIVDLSEDHRVLAVDLPGFGDSPRPKVAATLDSMLAMLGELLEQHGRPRCLLVGNCMGANLSLRLARSRTDLVRGVLAMNPLTEATFRGGRLGPLHAMAGVAPAPTRFMRSVARRAPIGTPAAVATVRFQLGHKGAGQGLQRDPELLACQKRADQLPALVDVLDDMDAYGRLDRDPDQATVPTWILWGAENRVLSRDAAPDLPRLVHADRVEVLQGCGHLPMLEDPRAVNAVIRELDVVTTAEVGS
jgi:pimeloyl-ACP methyl ester carboxylesterase